MHWSRRKQLADLFHGAFWAFKGKYSVERDDYPVSISYLFRFKGKLLDVSNTAAMIKLLEDGLVGIGLLPDDTPKYVGEIHIFVEKGEKDEVEIVIA